MAEIETYPLFRHLRAEPTSHVLGYTARRARAARAPGWRSGSGPSTRPSPRCRSTTASSRSCSTSAQADFQELTVQGVITYRVADPRRVARRIDFAIELAHGKWTQTPLEQLAACVTQLAQQFVIDELVSSTVRHDPHRRRRADPRPHRGRPGGRAGARASSGIEVVAVRVAAVDADGRAREGAAAADPRGDPADADEATFPRRALAAEKERDASAEQDAAAQEDGRARRRTDERGGGSPPGARRTPSTGRGGAAAHRERARADPGRDPAPRSCSRSRSGSSPATRPDRGPDRHARPGRAGPRSG